MFKTLTNYNYIIKLLIYSPFDSLIWIKLFYLAQIISGTIIYWVGIFGPYAGIIYWVNE